MRGVERRKEGGFFEMKDIKYITTEPQSNRIDQKNYFIHIICLLKFQPLKLEEVMKVSFANLPKQP